MNPEANNAQFGQAAQPGPRSNKKSAVTVVVVIVLALAAVAVTYTWQHKKVNDSQAKNAQLTAQLATAKKAQTQPSPGNSNSAASSQAPSAEATTQLVAGQADFDQNNLRNQPDLMYVDAYVKPAADLKEIWMDYGISADNLSLQSEHITKELALGEGDSYGNFTFTLKKSDLKPGTIYFYRISAVKGSATIHSGTAAFTSLK